ncbi:hypothetical protein [Pseudomonas sp. MYb185]|uniref:hypothetical protein n=1 Tax=Pseudomonas sp. MYb185 TaxID=1848729 RepID=UPI000CFC234F|nr:hypothetical protein [Pseudomonas sp. MYb185]PRB81507.1 hypothetical protein CQ007_10185 [Pseudomonas sp. MYb185]
MNHHDTTRTLTGLSEAGIAKLQKHLAWTGNEGVVQFEVARSDLIVVVSPQINNPDPRLAVEPWLFAMAVAGTTYPKTGAEHESSGYEEVCLSYYEADFQFEEAL